MDVGLDFSMLECSWTARKTTGAGFRFGSRSALCSASVHGVLVRNQLLGSVNGSACLAWVGAAVLGVVAQEGELFVETDVKLERVEVVESVRGLLEMRVGVLMLSARIRSGKGTQAREHFGGWLQWCWAR